MEQENTEDQDLPQSLLDYINNACLNRQENRNEDISTNEDDPSVSNDEDLNNGAELTFNCTSVQDYDNGLIISHEEEVKTTFDETTSIEVHDEYEYSKSKSTNIIEDEAENNHDTNVFLMLNEIVNNTIVSLETNINKETINESTAQENNADNLIEEVKDQERVPVLSPRNEPIDYENQEANYSFESTSPAINTPILSSQIRFREVKMIRIFRHVTTIVLREKFNPTDYSELECNVISTKKQKELIREETECKLLKEQEIPAAYIPIQTDKFINNRLETVNSCINIETRLSTENFNSDTSRTSDSEVSKKVKKNAKPTHLKIAFKNFDPPLKKGRKIMSVEKDPIQKDSKLVTKNKRKSTEISTETVSKTVQTRSKSKVFKEMKPIKKQKKETVIDNNDIPSSPKSCSIELETKSISSRVSLTNKKKNVCSSDKTIKNSFQARNLKCLNGIKSLEIKLRRLTEDDLNLIQNSINNRGRMIDQQKVARNSCFIKLNRIDQSEENEKLENNPRNLNIYDFL